ncbi:MAG TPA: prepilin-type N-terminal cleavage/methylation domain-containing protein [Gemmatimonadaceae bacterium]
MRPAFTLPEVLVALLVFSVGILGLAGSGTFLIVQVREAHALTSAAVLAGTVLDSLRALPCASVAGGTDSHGVVTLRWTTAASGPVVSVTTTVSVAGRRAPWQLTIDTLLPCDR